jgi:hypothetical protein
LALISARTGEGHERDRMSAEHLENQQAILSEAAEQASQWGGSRPIAKPHDEFGLLLVV